MSEGRSKRCHRGIVEPAHNTSSERMIYRLTHCNVKYWKNVQKGSGHAHGQGTGCRDKGRNYAMKLNASPSVALECSRDVGFLKLLVV